MNEVPQYGYGSRAVVVGGGLAGLAAAGLLARRGFAVALVESADEVGGLLRSRDDASGRSYDFGTHVLEESGIAELDELLLGPLFKTEGWNAFASCPSSNYFSGHLSPTGFIDARSLPEGLYAEGLAEMRSLTPTDESPPNLRAQLDASFGPSFRSNLFDPALRKFTGVDSESLAPNSHHLYGMKRLICGSPEEAVRWKSESTWNDSRFAFHDASVGARPGLHLYPKSGGMGTWARSVAESLSLGRKVVMKTGESIVSIDHGGGKVKSLGLRGGEVLKADLVVWTAPVVPLFRLFERPLPLGVVPPRFCRTTLVDLLVEGHACAEGFYVNCYDPSLRNFRTTLYGALERATDACPGRVTVEVMDPPADSIVPPPVVPGEIFEELKSMGIYPASARLVDSGTTEIERGFPVMSLDFAESSRRLTASASELASNVMLFGRVGGKGFFMSEILRDVYRRIEPLRTENLE